MATTTKPARRGKPFRKGRSGNPKGRPKGSRNKKELTLDEEIEALKQRAAEHVCAGRIGSARVALRKFYILNGCRPDDIELDRVVEETVHLFQTEAEKLQRLDLLEGLYRDHAEHSDGKFFKHIGLPKDATWEQFRAHYAVGDDDVDEDRACGDLATYPPIARRVAQIIAEQSA